MKKIDLGKYEFTKADQQVELKKVLPLTLVEEVVVEDGIQTIESNTFSGYSNLKWVTLPNTVTVIKFDAFSGCYNLKAITLPKSLKGIKGFAFRDCYSLGMETDGILIIPSSVGIIEDYAFINCFSIKAVVLCGNTIVEDRAFDGCNVNIYRAN